MRTEISADPVSVIRDYPMSEKGPAHLVAKELLSLAASSLLYPLGFTRMKKRTARRAEQRTVVLVHGYLANRSTLLPLSAYLQLRGLSVLGFDYRSGEGVERSAIALRDWLKKTVRGGRIDLVCHSMGGLVARSYLQQLGGARRVDRCITLGTPHRGTYNAYWIHSRVGREMRPDSAVLERLHQTRDQAARVRFTSIVAGSDNIIVPRVFSGGEDLVHLPDLGHIGMLFSPRVWKAVRDRLATA